MNYKRIYDQFIADRRVREAILTGYAEKHHIIPRSMGGGDEPGNLIRLSLGDHYFAHLLLAKIHGGKMWYAVFMMAHRSEKRDVYCSRRMYEVARRRVIDIERQKDGLKGADNGNHNPELWLWRNCDTGERRVSTLHDMWKEFGGNRAMWTSCASGQKQTALGWTLGDREVKRSSKGKTFHFVNRDGRRFDGTQKEFVAHAGVSLATASRMCLHEDVSVCGWRLSTTRDRSHAASKKTGRGARLNSGRTYRLKHPVTGEIVEGKLREMTERFNYKSPTSFSTTYRQLLDGRVKRMRGHVAA